MERLKAYKFRIYPDSEQQNKLVRTFGCVRFVWNKLTEDFNSWTPEREPTKINENTLKSKKEFEFLNEVSAATLQQKRMDFVETKKQFFNKKRKTKLGRMKFKNRQQKQSFRLPNQKFSLDQEQSTIRLEKIGYVKVVLDRSLPVDADFRSVTVSMTPTGKFYVSILVKVNVDLKPVTGRKVGIDLGLNDLFILSNGTKINNPRWFRENQTKLKKAQQHLSRKKKGSNRRNKQRIKVAKLHEKIANQRSYFLHNMSTALVDQFDVISIEDLNVKSMIKSNLAKSIHDAGWSEFVRQLDYKCQWYGKSLVKVDRFFPSTQLCSSCDTRTKKIERSVEEWNCSNCDTNHDRDVNAARNILKEGFKILTSAECVDYKRGEDVRLIDASHHLAASEKRLDKFIDLL